MAPPRGTWLTQQMERRQLSVRALADALSVTSKTVYDWRDGRTAISEERIPQLAEVLRVTEIEARRGLGFWVPTIEAGNHPRPDDLATIERLLEQAMAELARLKEEREIS